MLHLYEYPNSVCCQKVNLALIEKKLNWESITVNLGKNEHYSSDYLKLNPKAVVPTLTHNGSTIIESTLICEYLDAISGDNMLTPDNPLGRTQMRSWSKVIDEGLHDGVADISFSAMFRERMKKMPEDRRQQRFDNIGDPKRYDRGRSTFEVGVESPFVKYAVYAFEAAFQNIEAKLSDGREWLIKEHYSLADLGLTPYLARLEYLNLLDVWIQDKTNTNNWWQRIKQRPSYAQAVSNPLTKIEIDGMGSSGSKIKGKISQIRNELQKYKISIST